MNLTTSVILTPMTPRACGQFSFPDDIVANGPMMLTILATLPGGESSVVLDRSTASLLLLDNDGIGVWIISIALCIQNGASYYVGMLGF